MTSDEVVRIAGELRVSVRALSRVAAGELMGQVTAHHVPAMDARRPLWEQLEGSISVRDPDAWKWIASLARSQHLVLAGIDDSDAWWGVEFRDGADLVRVLSELPAFVFFAIANVEDAVVCFNDHDHLIAAGRRAIEWLTELTHQPRMQASDETSA